MAGRFELACDTIEREQEYHKGDDRLTADFLKALYAQSMCIEDRLSRKNPELKCKARSLKKPSLDVQRASVGLHDCRRRKSGKFDSINRAHERRCGNKGGKALSIVEARAPDQSEHQSGVSKRGLKHPAAVISITTLGPSLQNPSKRDVSRNRLSSNNLPFSGQSKHSKPTHLICPKPSRNRGFDICSRLSAIDILANRFQ